MGMADRLKISVNNARSRNLFNDGAINSAFIGSLAFASNIKAFTLHSFPAFISCLWLSPSENWLRMAYFFALPVVAIGIHHVLQRRNDRFAQELLSELLEERETLTDLSMMDPLTGLYNRRGLQSRLENLPGLTLASTLCC